MRPRPGVARAVIADGSVEITIEPGTDPMDESTRFEIGSITKTMTAALLARFVAAGAVGLDDPIGTWLDAEPCNSVTLGQLATHTSGLPRVPPKFARAFHFDRDDPYAEYGPEQLLRSMRHTAVPMPGEELYSNYGYMVLGHVLSLIGAAPLEDQIVEHVLGAWDLSYTSDERLVPGYHDGTRVPPWRFMLAGPGGIRSTVGAVAQWVQRAMHGPQLGWVIADTYRWHNGGTGGHSSWCGFDPATKRGAVVLSNWDGRAPALGTLGRQLLLESGA